MKPNPTKHSKPRCATALTIPPFCPPLQDDIGAVSINAYGGHRSTPEMDAMADSGRLYEYAYSMPACAPTR